MNKNITIKQIADRCGVHRSTVDKVLHNRTGVSDEVRKKIEEVIESTGYQPNVIGKALKHQEKRLLVPVLLLKVDALEEIQKGIESAYSEFKKFGMDYEYFITSDLDVQEQLKTIKQLQKREISGLIISPLNDERIKKEIDKMAARGIPVVTTNIDLMESKRMCFVGQDLIQAGRVAGNLMGEILYGAGKIAVITSSLDMAASKSRQKGFETVIRERYPDIEIIETIETNEQGNVTMKRTEKLLETYQDISGIFVTCGTVKDVGKAVMKKQRGEKIKIICFDLYPEIITLMQEGTVNFTIGQDLVSQGYLPFKIMFEYLFLRKKPEYDHVRTTTEIKCRESII